MELQAALALAPRAPSARSMMGARCFSTSRAIAWRLPHSRQMLPRVFVPPFLVVCRETKRITRVLFGGPTSKTNPYWDFGMERMGTASNGSG